jgi:GH15 family glucan-1,4-alpha-glucosidase
MIRIDRSRLGSLARHSVAVIRANQSPSGAYLASPTFPVYRYSWLRDGSFIADAMSRAGDIASAEAFFGWCARVIAARADRIDELVTRHAAGDPIDRADFLPTRYTVDGTEGTEDWTEFQLDGYGTWLWALTAHARRHDRSVEPWLDGALLSARYVVAFWDHPSYDWWEEHPDRVHTSTLGAICAGLEGAATWPTLTSDRRAGLVAAAAAIRRSIVEDGRRAGHLAKWLGGDAVDASLVALATPFDVLEPDDPLMRATVARIEAELVHGQGVHRYRGDSYFGGGEWILLSALLGWHWARTGRSADAQAALDWIAAQATAAGDLPEQVSDHLLVPAQLAPWVERWGPVATPLLWSHATYLSLAIELGIVAPPVTAA